MGKLLVVMIFGLTFFIPTPLNADWDQTLTLEQFMNGIRFNEVKNYFENVEGKEITLANDYKTGDINLQKLSPSDYQISVVIEPLTGISSVISTTAGGIVVIWEIKLLVFFTENGKYGNWASFDEIPEYLSRIQPILSSTNSPRPTVRIKVMAYGWTMNRPGERNGLTIHFFVKE